MSKITDNKTLIQRQLINMRQEKTANEYFKSKINDTIKHLGEATKYINEAKEEIKKAYSGQALKEKLSKLDNDIQQIKNIESELQTSLTKINSRIASLKFNISKKENELRSL